MTMRKCVHCQAYTPVENGKCTVCGNINKGIGLGEQVVRDGLSNDKLPYHIKYALALEIHICFIDDNKAVHILYKTDHVLSALFLLFV